MTNTAPTKEIELGPDAKLLLFEDAVCVDAEDVRAVMALLRVQEKQTFKMFNRQCTMHRRQLMFGKGPYAFSGTKVELHQGETPPLVSKCIAFAKAMYPDANHNAALGVFYGPDDYVSKHRDNENKHRPGQPIVGFSFGEQRPIVIKKYKRDRDDDELNLSVVLPHGSAYVMQGCKFQRDFTHQVDKGKGERLSITVREFA